MNIEKLRKAPGPGHLTGEQKRGDKNINALMDLFPEGTMLSMTIVTQPRGYAGAGIYPAGEKLGGGKHRLAAYPPGRGNRQRFTGAPP